MSRYVDPPTGRSHAVTFYVAGSTSDLDRVREVQETIRNAGGMVTFDWTGQEGEIRADWEGHESRGAELAQIEVQACLNADIIVLVAPPAGRGLGCFLETGIGLGNGADVWLVEATRDSLFWCHPRVKRFTLLQCLEAIYSLVAGPAEPRDRFSVADEYGRICEIIEAPNAGAAARQFAAGDRDREVMVFAGSPCVWVAGAVSESWVVARSEGP